MRRAQPVGPHRVALVLDDKWTSHEFAREHGLPYVDSPTADDAPAVARLLDTCGYPLIAKPRVGNGSRGVRIVFDDAQHAAIARRPSYLLQGYLEPEPELAARRDLTRQGTPLFHAPTLQQIACQAVVGPDGDVLGLLCTMVEMVMGRCERTYGLGEARTADVARRYVSASAGKGWVGMLNLQGRRDPGGTFRGYELSGRFTGASAARLHLGFDEVGMLIESFTGRMLPHPRLGSAGVVTKSLADFPLPDGAVEQLQAAGRSQPG